jgi:DNA-binding NtrC family response regulator
MLLTGYTEVESVIEAINSGQIYRYITKPWDPNDLVTAMKQAVERYALGREIQKKNRELEIAFEELRSLDPVCWRGDKHE